MGLEVYCPPAELNLFIFKDLIKINYAEKFIERDELGRGSPLYHRHTALSSLSRKFVYFVIICVFLGCRIQGGCQA